MCSNAKPTNVGGETQNVRGVTSVKAARVALRVAQEAGLRPIITPALDCTTRMWNYLLGLYCSLQEEIILS